MTDISSFGLQMTSIYAPDSRGWCRLRSWLKLLQRTAARRAAGEILLLQKRRDTRARS